MEPERIRVEHCPSCQQAEFFPVALRSDGVGVLECRRCGLDFVESVPADIAGLYGEAYFQKSGGETIPFEGYADYDAIPASEFSWRVNLVRQFGAPGGKLLDIGCATGKFLELASKAGWEAHGVEISGFAARLARRRGFNVHCGTLETAAYPDGAFDIVTAFDLLEHLPEPRRFLVEVKRILKPGGVFIVLTPNAGAFRALAAGNGWIGYTVSLEHILYFRPRTLKAILRETFAADPFMIAMDQGEYDALVAVVRYADPGEPVGRAKRKRSKVLFVNRTDAFARPGGDTVQMVRTGEHLRRLGCEVDVSLCLQPEASGYDLVHVFNLQRPREQLPQVRHLQRYGTPIVLSPIYWDTSEALWADMATKAAFGQAGNEGELGAYLERIEDGSLAVRDVTVHSRPEPYPGFRAEQREILWSVDFLLPNSYMEMRQIGLSLGVHNQAFAVVPNAVEARTFAEASPEWFLSRFGLRDFVIAAGRFEATKNQLMLVHALQGTGLQMVLVGACGDKKYLDLCRRFAPPGTLFIVDNLSQEELASAFAAARVHVLPSWGETTGLVSLEAALAGCSNVVSDRGAQWEYFREYAYYCNPASAASIRAAVTAAYSNYDHDAPKRRRFQKLILQWYTWNRTAKETLSAYARTIRLFRQGALTRAVDDVGSPARRAARFRFSAFPDWSDPHYRWVEVLTAFAQAFKPGENVSLVLWVDPMAHPDIGVIYERVSGALIGSGLEPDAGPDIVLEHKPIAGQDPDALLQGTQVLILCGGPSDPAMAERARVLGRPVLEKPTPTAMRDLFENKGPAGPLLSPG